jgi:endonuclease/exonuclease/phosphatase family metal-dependent hydrolase
VQWFLGLDGRVDIARVIGHAQQMCDFDVLCLQEVAIHFPGLEGGADFDQVSPSSTVQATFGGAASIESMT